MTTNISLHQQIGIDNVSNKILEKAAEINVNLIVMSTHGRTGLGHVLIGSIIEK